MKDMKKNNWKALKNMLINILTCVALLLILYYFTKAYILTMPGLCVNV